MQSGNWALCREEKNDIYLFKMHEKQKLRGIQNVLDSEWLNVNVDIADKQLMRT